MEDKYIDVCKPISVTITSKADNQTIKELRSKLRKLVTDLPIGSTFKADDIEYVVIEDIDRLACQGCDFCNSETGACTALELFCYKYDRDDKKNVIFKKTGN